MPVEKHRKLLGEAIRDRRKEVGLTQEKLAEKSNLSTIFISRIERGVDNSSVDSLVKIAKALGVQVRDIVSEF